MEKTLLIIFKTHLDIGFTDYSEEVVKNYLDSFIPNAIRVGNELRDTDTPFIWTVGSFLIDRALKNDSDGSVERAVRDGILNWHALPYTSHTELMNETLFEYALDISRRLDERFDRKTTGAKMTDVPGHTKAMIPQLARHGVKFLHIGINPATPVPPVPRLFRWKCGDDAITVMYEGDYGKIADFGDFAVCFAHTGDNLGPQNKEQIIKVYDDLREKFPGYKLKAATISDLGELAVNVPEIPTLDCEIGDTWIHGAATDPEKLSRYRRVLRYIRDNGVNADLADNLLLVPEHTWGMDVKKYFPNTTHFSADEMESIPEERKTIEKSWDEQRNYVRKAEEILGLEPEYPVKMPCLDGFTECGSKNVPFELCWQIYDNSDYDRYRREYMRIFIDWARWDFTKVGLPDYKGETCTAKVTEVWQKGDTRVVRLEFDEAERYGLPYFYATICGGKIELEWFGKRINRMPQACHLKFTELGEDWSLERMGRFMRPESFIGSPLIAAIDTKIRNRDYTVTSYDAALVEPFGRKLLHYADRGEEQELWFCLYDNIWNTNFPMWYGDDAMFRFEIEKNQ